MSDRPEKEDFQNAKPVVAAVQSHPSLTRMRTDSFTNENKHLSYIESWSAYKTDVENDKWAVREYMMHDLTSPQGFLDVNVVADDIPFVDALKILHRKQLMGKQLEIYTPVDVAATYPAAAFPWLQDVLKSYFIDGEDYLQAAYIEGYVPAADGSFVARKKGVVMESATIALGDLSAAAQFEKSGASQLYRMEDGLLSDIFNSVRGGVNEYDALVKLSESLRPGDKLVDATGAFYLGVLASEDKSIAYEDTYAQLDGFMSEEQRRSFFDRAMHVYGKNEKGDRVLIFDIIDRMNACVKKMEKSGLMTEPYQKMVAECALYARLLQAVDHRKNLEASLEEAGSIDDAALVDMQEAVANAEDIFFELGGTKDQASSLRAWVYRQDEHGAILPSLPQFINRYVRERNRVTTAVMAHQAGVRNIVTMGFDVKTPAPLQDKKNNAQNGPTTP